MYEKKEIEIDKIVWSELNSEWNEHHNPVTQERAKFSKIQNQNIGDMLEEIKKRENDIKDLEKLSRWLMGYVMDLHSFRNQLFKHKDYESMKSGVRDNFPQLQGFKQQRLFRELGIDPKENQESIKSAIKLIMENNKK